MNTTSTGQLKFSKSTSSMGKLKRELKRKSPKIWAKIEKKWDYKMLIPVMDFVYSIMDNVNPRLKKLVRKNEYIISAEDIEEKVWKLLVKARRLK